MSYACGHCKGFGVHDNNPSNLCIACGRTGLLPHPQTKTENAFLSRKSREVYKTCMETIGLSPFSVKNKSFKVVVAGSGIAGAALTLALQQRGIQVVCYERDTHFNQRAQGYGLTIQQAGAAVHALGVDCDHNNIAFAITHHNAFSHTGELLGSYGSLTAESIAPEVLKSKKAPKHNIIITRQDLRQKMINKLTPDTIQWGISVIGYTEQTSESDESKQSLLTVHLSNGKSIKDCSLLVGCEGIRSTIRRQKLQVCKPLRFLKTFVILGIAQISLPSRDEENGPQPSNHHLLKHKTCVNQASDACTRIYSMPFDEDTIMWQLSFPISFQAALELQSSGPEGWLAESKRRCLSWELDYITPLLNNTPVHTVTGYPAYDRNLPSPEDFRKGFLQPPPPGLEEIEEMDTVERGPSEAPSCSQTFCNTFEANKRVTLLGDAMHPCSPFKAQGANQALLDAVYCARSLSALLIKLEGEQKQQSTSDNDNEPPIQPTIDQLDEVLVKFEKEMIIRTTPKVYDSRNHIELLHSAVTLSHGDMPRAHVAKSALTQHTVVADGVDENR